MKPRNFFSCPIICVNLTLLHIMKWPSNEQERKYGRTHYVSHGNTGINGKRTRTTMANNGPEPLLTKSQKLWFALGTCTSRVCSWNTSHIKPRQTNLEGRSGRCWRGGINGSGIRWEHAGPWWSASTFAGRSFFFFFKVEFLFFGGLVVLRSVW